MRIQAATTGLEIIEKYAPECRISLLEDALVCDACDHIQEEITRDELRKLMKSGWHINEDGQWILSHE